MAILGGFDADDDPLRVDRINDSASTANHHSAGIAGCNLFHTGSNQRRRSAQQRYGLALHVRSHQGAVCVIVFEKRDERCGDRNELLRRNIDVIDLVPMLEHEIARLPNIDKLVRQPPAFVHLFVRLRDEILVFFPGREVERIRNIIGALLFTPLQLFILLFDSFALDVLADFELGVTGADDRHIIDNASVLYFAIRTFDESIFVDPRVATQ